MAKGGRRTGSGAPKGNMNAAKHMRRSKDPYLRMAMRMLPKAWAERLTMRMRKQDPEAWAEASEIAAQWALEDERLYLIDGNAPTPLRDEPSISPSPSPPSKQSKPVLQVVRGGEGLLDEVVGRLTEWGFRPGPRNWLRLHRELMSETGETWIEMVGGRLDELDTMDDEMLRQFREGPMGFLNGVCHGEIAVLNDEQTALICPRRPLCLWRRSGRQLRLKAEGS